MRYDSKARDTVNRFRCSVQNKGSRFSLSDHQSRCSFSSHLDSSACNQSDRKSASRVVLDVENKSLSNSQVTLRGCGLQERQSPRSCGSDSVDGVGDRSEISVTVVHQSDHTDGRCGAKPISKRSVRRVVANSAIINVRHIQPLLEIKI